MSTLPTSVNVSQFLLEGMMPNKYGLGVSLQREADSGERAAGLGFLPGMENPVDDGKRCDDRDDPERRGHAVEQSADDQKNHALGALHEAYFAKRDQGFGARAR